MPPPNRPKNRPNRPKRNRPSPKRRGAGGRKAAAKRQQRVNRARRDNIREEARRGGGGSKKGADIRTGGQSTGREAGIAAANKYIPKKKQKDLQQSVGSLDRRINTALQKGNTALAKDLRSKKKGFVKKLGLSRAHEAMINAAPLSKRDQIKKQIKANPNMLNTTGKEIFDETMDMDYLDPTRQLQNEYPEAYKEMYPASNLLQRGPIAYQGLKSIFGKDDKKIPYTDPDMPGVRYPLDTTWGAGEGATPITTRSDRQGPLDEKPFTISDRQEGIDFIPDTKPAVTEKDKQAAIDRGISPEFIFSLPDDPRTELIESDLNTGSALQLAEAANVQDTLSDLVRPEFTSSNVFALPEQAKADLNKQAEVNRKEYEIETYGREITDDDLAKANISPSYYNMDFSTPLVQQQLLKSGVIEKDSVQPAISERIFSMPTKGTTYTGQEWLDKQASDKATALSNIQADNTLNDSQKIQLTDFINNPPDMTTGLLDQNNLSLSDMVVNENFDTGVNTDQRSVDVLNSLAEPNTSSNYLQRLFGFNK